ncbi:MAG: acyltransferase family protein, partial [Acidimicrobiales bacterium]
AAELLVGAVVALGWADPLWRQRLRRGIWPLLGVVALVGTVWSWHTVTQTDGWLYRGGFALYAAGSAAVIVAAIQPGPVRAVLSSPPLRWLGSISYAVYLFHWPIFLWLTPARTGLDPWPLFALRITITLALAQISLLVLEQPVRQRRLLTGRTPLWLAPLTATCILTTTTLTTNTTPPPTELRTAEIPTEFAGPDASADAGSGTAGATGEVPPSLPVSALVVGDSMAVSLNGGLQRWVGEHGGLKVANAGTVGCGIGIGGRIRGTGIERATFPECDERIEKWPLLVAERRPDYVVVLSCLWDVADRRIPGDRTWRSPGDPVLDEWLRQSVERALDALSSTGARVVWLTCPYLDPVYSPQNFMGRGPYPEAEPARTDRWNQLLREVAASRPSMVVWDLAALLERSWPGGQLDPERRPDGVHFTEESSYDVVAALAPALVSRSL